MVIAMAMAELGSAAPTSGKTRIFSTELSSDKYAGGLYYWTYKYSSPRCRNVLCWMVGYLNTITYVSGVAAISFSSASAVMAAVTIGSNGTFIPTVYQT